LPETNTGILFMIGLLALGSLGSGITRRLAG